MNSIISSTGTARKNSTTTPQPTQRTGAGSRAGRCPSSSAEDAGQHDADAAAFSVPTARGSGTRSTISACRNGDHLAAVSWSLSPACASTTRPATASTSRADPATIRLPAAGPRARGVEEDGCCAHRCTASRRDRQVKTSPIGRVRMTKPAAMMTKIA